jgi:hypothetical protein
MLSLLLESALAQYFQPVSLSLAQLDALRFHRPSATYETGHSYFAQTGHSFCSDSAASGV